MFLIATPLQFVLAGMQAKMQKMALVRRDLYVYLTLCSDVSVCSIGAVYYCHVTLLHWQVYPCNQSQTLIDVHNDCAYY